MSKKTLSRNQTSLKTIPTKPETDKSKLDENWKHLQEKEKDLNERLQEFENQKHHVD